MEINLEKSECQPEALEISLRGMGSYWLLLSGRLFQSRYSVLRNCRNREHLALRDEDHYYPGGGKEEEMEQDHTLCTGGVLSWKIITETWLRLLRHVEQTLRWKRGNFKPFFWVIHHGRNRKDWKCPAIPLPRGDGWKHGIYVLPDPVCVPLTGAPFSWTYWTFSSIFLEPWASLYGSEDAYVTDLYSFSLSCFVHGCIDTSSFASQVPFVRCTDSPAPTIIFLFFCKWWFRSHPCAWIFVSCRLRSESRQGLEHVTEILSS